MDGQKSKVRHVAVGDVTFGNDLPLVLIAGPCAIEGKAHALEMAGGRGSKPFDPHPLFSSFVGAAVQQSRLV